MNIFVDVIGSIILKVLFSFAGGWTLMLSIGIIHNDWLPGVRPIGYQVAVLLTILLTATLWFLKKGLEGPDD